MTFGEIKKETQFLLGLENDVNFVIYSEERITDHSNRALEELTSLILKTDGRWQWDDRNHTDLPIATADILSGQSQYTLDVEHLSVSRLELLKDGVWHKLVNIDESDVSGAVSELEKEEGTPKYYDLQGESIILYPKPNYSQDEGLKIWYSRPASYFKSGEDTKEPGFNKLFHLYIPIWNALHYASSNPDMSLIASNMKVRLDEMKAKIKDWYRTNTKTQRLTVKLPSRY